MVKSRYNFGCTWNETWNIKKEENEQKKKRYVLHEIVYTDIYPFVIVNLLYLRSFCLGARLDTRCISHRHCVAVWRVLCAKNSMCFRCFGWSINNMVLRVNFLCVVFSLPFSVNDGFCHSKCWAFRCTFIYPCIIHKHNTVHNFNTIMLIAVSGGSSFLKKALSFQ